MSRIDASSSTGHELQSPHRPERALCDDDVCVGSSLVLSVLLYVVLINMIDHHQYIYTSMDSLSPLAREWLECQDMHIFFGPRSIK
jgi:hypothetical protein